MFKGLNLNIPIIPDKFVRVKDANGNIGILHGLVKQVPLIAGAVQTVCGRNQQ